MTRRLPWPATLVIAIPLLTACGASAPKPTGPGPEYEDPPMFDAGASSVADGSPVDAALR